MIKDIIKGIQAYGNTFKLINKLGLWKYFGVPILISILTAVLIGITAWGLADNLGEHISKIWYWNVGAETFRTISYIIGAAIVIAVGFILYKHIIMALSAPFMSPVSEKIELYLLGSNHKARSTSNLSQLWRGIQINLRNLLMELLLTIPIVIIFFIPIINIFATIPLFLVQSYYAGFSNMDYTLERHFNVKESVQFVKQNRGVAIGNGMVFMLMLFIPVLGIILVLPLSVTASTIETLRVIHADNKLNLSESIQNKINE